MRGHVEWVGVALLALGCVREPDPGGQEGEEIFGEEASVVDSGQAGGGDDGGGGEVDTGEPDDGADSTDWSSWGGALERELGQSTELGARDCTLVWSMEGSPSPLTCTDCVAVFDVVHVLNEAESEGAEACSEHAEPFARTYGLVLEDDNAVAVWVARGSADFAFLAAGTLEDGLLQWSAGTADEAVGTGEDVEYVTDLETAVVQLR